MEKTPGLRLAPNAHEAPLPAERAFVVQLRGHSGLGGDLFVGRAEHIASGAVGRFGSRDGLIAFIEETLASQTPGPISDPVPTAKKAERT